MPELKTIDSSRIPSWDRVEAIAEQGRKDIIPTDIDYGGNDPRVLGAVIDLGAARLSSYDTNAIEVGRTRKRTEDDYPPAADARPELERARRPRSHRPSSRFVYPPIRFTVHYGRRAGLPT